MSFLSVILDAKRLEIEEAKPRMPESRLLDAPRRDKPDLADAIKKTHGLSVIAEIKRASPSAGSLAPELNLPRLVRAYELGEAAAISILTDARFMGNLDDLRTVRAMTALPLLRKDFIIDTYQVAEAAWAGADAILLIMAALADEQFKELMAAARQLELSALVEVHDRREMERACTLGARIIGVNNRNLATFEVDTNTAANLLPHVPPGMTAVAESGIATPADAEAMAERGADAVLVGEALVRSNDPAGLIRRFREAGHAR